MYKMWSVVFILLLSTNVSASNYSEKDICQTFSRMFETVMEARLSGMERVEMYKILRSSVANQAEFQRLSPVVYEAYNFDVLDNDKETISSFVKFMSGDCLIWLDFSNKIGSL